MDYDKARQELSDSRHNTSPTAKADIVARIAAEATLSIAESLARIAPLVEAWAQPMRITLAEEQFATPQPEPEQYVSARRYVVGDRARIVGDLSLRAYFVDEVRNDGQVVLLDDGNFEASPSSLIYIDHPRDEPSTADDDTEGDWHEETVAGGISALKAKADKKAKAKK